MVSPAKRSYITLEAPFTAVRASGILILLRSCLYSCHQSPQFTFTIMGEAPRPREHILCLLPIPEDPKILNRLRRKYDVEFTYKQVITGAGEPEIPDGKLLLQSLFNCSISTQIKVLIILLRSLRNLAQCYHTRNTLDSPTFGRKG